MTSLAERPETTPAANAPLLKVEGMKVHFPIKEGIIFERHIGDVRAVDGVSFELH